MVVDASGSMESTDPESLRFEAMNQFASLLSSKGNLLGGVAFTTEIAGQHDLAAVQGQQDKEAVLQTLEAVSPKGDTNIGAALQTALDMIGRDGDQDLPSVILLLSDGNTDMPSAEELQQSLDQKAEGILRARDEGIRVYSVCLNANESADVSEMQQIADATNGTFIEVKHAEDLQSAFEAFYSLIYGTQATPLGEDSFGADGTFETDFAVPPFGVEEANVLIDGKPSSVKLEGPDGAEPAQELVNSRTFSMVKLTDVMPGNYHLVLSGVPGEAVRVRLVLNADLEVEASSDPESGAINPEDPLTCTAYLSSHGERATNAEQYRGFEATLQLFDAFDEPVESLPMEVVGDRFELSQALPEGTYRMRVDVQGSGLERSSAMMGPVSVTTEAMTEAEKANTAPVPVENPVNIEVAIWPLRDSSQTIDLTLLASDEQGDPLQYRVVSSSFRDDDYRVADDVLTITNYSVSKGAFTVRAVDRFGLSCDIEVIVRSYNVGLMALVGMGIAVLVGLVVFVVLLRIALRKPFRGDITAESRVNGKASLPKKVTGRRGRLPLSAFDLDPTALDYRKSYFQATGDRYVLLRTDVPVTFNDAQTKEVRIESGVRTTVTVAPGQELRLRFESRMKQSAARGSRARGGNRRGFGR